jgi:hypothetical protein
MVTLRSCSFAQCQRGQNAVEFALLLPLLALIFFGVLDFGRGLHIAITITNSAREGARYGMVHPDDWDGVIAAVEAEAADSGIDLTDPEIADIQVSCPDSPGATSCESGEPIRVEITYTFELILALVFPEGELPVTSYAEMLVP